MAGDLLVFSLLTFLNVSTMKPTIISSKSFAYQNFMYASFKYFPCQTIKFLSYVYTYSGTCAI